MSVDKSLRADGRTSQELRELELHLESHPYADSACQVFFGTTRLLICGLVKEQGQGQVHVSITMLPIATRLRNPSTELSAVATKEVRQLESLCGTLLEHSLQAAGVQDLDIDIFVTICHADGGVAAAAVAGGWLVLYQALCAAAEQGLITEDLDLPRVAAISAGVVKGELRVDLLSDETLEADFHVLVTTERTKGISGIHIEGNALQSNQEMLEKINALCLAAAEKIYEAQAAAVDA